MTWTRLHDACEHLDAKCIFERCKISSNDLHEVDDHGSTPLHILAWGNPKPELVQALISCCPSALMDKDVHGDTCLHVACSYPTTDVKVIKLMIDACPTLPSITNKEGLMPLHVACRFVPRNEALIGYLIDAYPSALRSHIKMGSPPPPRKHKDSSSNNNAISPRSDHFVTPHEGTNFSELRFQNLSTQVRDGAYPLHMAVKAGAPRHILEMLIKAADDVLLCTNKFGETPLHIALMTHAHDSSSSSSFDEIIETDEIVELLVETGPNALHIKERVHKNLPLHVAAIHGCSVRVAKALLEHFMSSIHEKNADGKTAMDLAIESEKSSDEVLRLFEISDNSSSSSFDDE